MNINNKFFIFSFFSLLFCAILIRSFYVTAITGIETHKENLIHQADLHYQDIINTRSWNASLGGIYAYQGNYKPNPYLKNNTIKDSNNKTMIKINPAWMTRMLSEHSTNQEYRFSLKSNNPLNPKNKAVGFYAQSLKEISDTVNTTNNNKRFRILEKIQKLEYIHGMYLKETCLSCHTQKEDKIGSLRGGVVVEINAKSYFKRASEIWYEFYSISAIVVLLFILLIVVLHKFFNRAKQVEILNATLEYRIKQKTLKLHNALEGARLGYWSWNIQTNQHTVDDRWLLMLGLTKDDVSNKAQDWNKRIHPDDRSNVNSIIKDAISENKPYVVEFRMKHKNGTYVWIQGSGSIISYDKNNKALELAGTHQDITNRKELEQKEMQNSIYLTNLFDKNPNIIVLTDGQRLHRVNQTFFDFFKKYSSLEMFLKEHKCICEFFEEGENEEFLSNSKNKWIEEVFQREQPVAKIRYESYVRYFSVQAKKLYEDNNMYNMVIFSDITEMYYLQKKYEQLSITDPLTGLYNRRYFNTIFTQEMHRALRAKHSLTFLILDIDYFKSYNDNYGHDKGDTLLQDLSKELETILKRSNEFVFRLGGEEFGVIYSNLSIEESILQAQNICNSIENLQLEHLYNLPSKVLTVSIGHFYTIGDANIKADEIYHKADKALYYAKEHGRNRVSDYGDLIIP